MSHVDVDRLMDGIETNAAGDRRARLLAKGAAAEYADPELFAAVERTLRRALDRDEQAVPVLELLDDDDEWRLHRGLRFSSHRPLVGPVMVFVNRRLLLPLTRWLFEYSRENVRRQQRVNRVLAACIEELAMENARLRQELKRR